MARDKHEVIHATGYDHTSRIWTACGLRAEEMGAILAYEPDCPACLLLIDGCLPPESEGGLADA